VISTSVAVPLRLKIRSLLLGLCDDLDGKTILAGGRLRRFVVRDDHLYDPIRRMARLAEGVVL
jgi:hypothetical protein